MQSRLKLLRDVLLRFNGPLLPRTHEGLLPSLTQLPTRRLSTDAAADASEAAAEPSSDPFLQVPSKGLVYGRLTGTGRFTLKTDIVHFFEGCGLSVEDIKVVYSRIYTSLGMLLQFSSHSNFDSAQRLITRKGRLYRLDEVDRGQWNLLKPYNGKVALLQGLPLPTSAEDVGRFLSGCNFDASSIQLFQRAGFPEPTKLALVNFPSQIEATNAFYAKNRAFCANSPITMRVLQ